MCGRYQFTEPQNADLRRILQDVRRRCGDRAQDFRFGDVMPTAAAPVLIANGGKVVADLQTWGIPGWKGGLMINARAETVCEKPMFRRSMAAQRCVIPATSFYEWDAARHKYQFALPGEPLYLAGLYDNVDGAYSRPRLAKAFTCPCCRCWYTRAASPCSPVSSAPG